MKIESSHTAAGCIKTHIGQSAHPAVLTCLLEVPGVEGERAAVCRVGDHRRPFRLLHRNSHSPFKFAAICAPAGKFQIHRSENTFSGDKAHPVQIGICPTVVALGLRHLTVIVTIVISVIQRPLGGAGQLEADIAQPASSHLLTEIVKISIVKGDKAVGLHPVLDEVRSSIHADLQLAREVLSIRPPPGKGNGDHARKIPGRHEGHLVQIGTPGAVIAFRAGHLAVIISVIIAIVQGPLGCGGRVKADMIERAPRQFTAQRVEIVVIQCDFSISMDGIADISFAAPANGHLHSTGKPVSLCIPGVKIDLRRSGEIPVCHKGDPSEVRGRRPVIAASLCYPAVIGAVSGIVVIQSPL